MSYPVIVVPFMKPAGMALFPFILIKHKRLLTDAALINHERIHLQQQLEMLVIPFYIAYLLHYLYNLYKYRDHHRAYMHIIFEREAYRHDSDLTYLQKRRFWAWIKA